LKAVRITRPGGPGVLELDDLEAPRPGPGEVAVDVRCTALNRADLLQRAGRYPAPPGAPADLPGLEYAGVVASAGSGVKNPAPGDRVMGLIAGGAYAERVVVAADQTIPIPANLDFVQAAALPEACFTAWDALRQAEFEPGESVLVHAAGSGVGTAALQLARALGASRILGTASSGKLAAIAAAGLPLDVPIDYEATEDIGARIREGTGGAGVDVILELVGAAYWQTDIASLAPRGRLVLIGLMSGVRAETDLGTILRHRLRVIGTVMRTRGAREKAELARSVRDVLLPRFADGSIVPVIHAVMPLANAAEAHALMEANRNFGKIVLRVS
jgi:putative PIG3 family NAD(P)H quinone oxidoreductase